MLSSSVAGSFFLIFSGAAVLAAIALYLRQPLLIAYVAIGCAMGPHALSWVADPTLLAEIAEIGIVFLLFLVGLDLQPSKLRNMVGRSLIVALTTSAIFFALGVAVMKLFGFSWPEAWVTGAAVTFSSTIIGIKLLPTTVLHHRHIGELVVSLLLIQDLLAIITLLILNGFGSVERSVGLSIAVAAIALPAVVLLAVAGVRFAVLPLLRRFDAFHEFIFLLAIGWCLGISWLAHSAGLSLAIGAFVAGVSLANSPIAQYIAESLRPLRDFFLVLFFFSVGAALDMHLLFEVALPTIVLAGVLIAVKPVTFATILRWQRESRETAWEIGNRLGQASEFSLMVSYVATSAAILGTEAAHVLQGATVITLIASTYLVIFRYPSPIAPSAALRRD